MEDDVRFYIGELIMGMQHLNKLGIIHCDVKQENILLHLQGHIVLRYTGISKEIVPREEQQAYSGCHTLLYMALELVEVCAAGHGMAVDW
jgi:p90 ribosomal S6 kinase